MKHLHRGLDTTLSDLALRYLTNGTLANDEISQLLDYSNPNSFFRSFMRLTESSPGEARKLAGEVGQSLARWGSDPCPEPGAVP